MAEFDEGRVSSVSIFRGENTNDPNSENASQFLELRLREFLSAFQISGNKTYSHDFASKKEYLEVDINDLGKFDPKLRTLLEDDPMSVLPTFEKVASEIARSIHSSENDDDVLEGGIQIILKSSLNDKALGSSLRALTSQRISKLVQVPGIIIGAATPQAKATHMTIQCKDCRMTQTITVKPGLGTLSLPRTCNLSTNAFQIGQKKCSLDPFVILPHKSKFVDQQSLKLQEQPEDVPPGDLPRRMLLVADRHLVDRVTPGTRVVAIGIYSVYEAKSGNKSNVRHPYFRVVGLRADDQDSNQAITRITDDEKTKFLKFAQNPDLYHTIHNILAPEIFGHDIIKQAIACLLFGGVRKRMKDGTHRRGDVNVLLLGDPSTAKSQFLKFTSKVAPIAVYTSGKGSSAAGLTAAVIQDPASREFYLEGGAMVLADNGVVCIDEFDKMRPEDRVAIHEAMEQQTISIAKAGINTMLKSRTSVLAAANPPKGRYDDLKTAQENIDLQTTILSRFDLIFIVKDIRNKEQDTKIARHVIQHHKSGIAPHPGMSSVPILGQDVDFLRRYIQFCRMESTPRLSTTALELLQNEYVNMREEARRVADMGSGIAVPITIRQLEALIRLSESIAKMQLAQEVNVEHVEKAIKLFKVSTMDAVRAGLTEGVEFSAEQRVELQRVENQIKQRLQPNECISEGRLVDHLSRMGYDASLVKRSIIMMLRQRDLEQVGGKNILKRVR